MKGATRKGGRCLWDIYLPSESPRTCWSSPEVGHRVGKGDWEAWPSVGPGQGAGAASKFRGRAVRVSHLKCLNQFRLSIAVVFFLSICNT